MILKFSLNNPMVWMICIKILKNKIQTKKICIVFDDMIADMLSSKKLNPIDLIQLKQRNISL